MAEGLTIVVALGTARGWRAPLVGALVAIVLLPLRLSHWGRYDPFVAVGIALALAVTGAAARAGFDPWWLLAAAVSLVLGWSLRRATRKQPT